MLSALLIIIFASGLAHAQINSDSKETKTDDSNSWTGVETNIQDRARSAHPPGKRRIYIENGSGYLSPGFGEIPTGNFPSQYPGYFPQYPNFGPPPPPVGYRPPLYTFHDRTNYFYRNKDEELGHKEDGYRSF